MTVLEPQVPACVQDHDVVDVERLEGRGVAVGLLTAAPEWGGVEPQRPLCPVPTPEKIIRLRFASFPLLP